MVRAPYSCAGLVFYNHMTIDTNTETKLTVFRVKNIKLNTYVRDATTLTRNGVIFDDFERAKDAIVAFVENTKLPMKEMRIVKYTGSEDQVIGISR